MVPGIDVEIRIELLQRDIQAAAFQQASDGRRRDAFAQGGNHAAGYKYVFRHRLTCPALRYRACWPASNSVRDAFQILRRIHAQGFIIRLNHANAESVFERAQLFQFFRLFERPDRKVGITSRKSRR